MKRILPVIFLSSLSPLVHAGTDVIITETSFELRNKDGAVIKNAKNMSQLYKTVELCIEAGNTQVPYPEKFQCAKRWNIERIPNCVGVPDPVPLVDPEGFTLLEAVPEPKLCPDGNSYEIGAPNWIRDDKFPPSCGRYEFKVTWACGQVAAEPAPVPANEPGINPPGANVIDPATGLGTDPAVSGCGPDDRQCGAPVKPVTP